LDIGEGWRLRRGIAMFQSSNLPNSSGGGWGISEENRSFEIAVFPLVLQEKRRHPNEMWGGANA
jgi:hypothetical protein